MEDYSDVQAEYTRWEGRLQAEYTEWEGRLQAECTGWEGRLQAEYTGWEGRLQAEYTGWELPWGHNCTSENTEAFDRVSSIVVFYIRVVILTQIRGSYLSKVSSTEHSKVIVVLQSLQMRRHTREEQESKEKCILSWFLVPFFER